MSFAANVYPIFVAARCPTCHGAAAGLDLSASMAYANLVNRTATECSPTRVRVAPGAPQSSYLLDKLLGVNLCAGQRMPRGGPFLMQSELDLVQEWIASGAPP